MKTITAVFLLSIGVAGCNLGHKQFRTDLGFEEDVGKCQEYSDLHEIPDVEQRALIQDICAEDNLLSFATIEFKDNGTFWERKQLLNVEREIERISRAQLLAPEDRGEAILLVLYIHGWRHNASEASRDLLNFRQFAHQLASSSTVCNSKVNENACRREQRPHVLAVYLGWRGDSTGLISDSIPLALRRLLKIGQLATFWHRKRAARSVAGVAMTEAILTMLSCIDDADRWRRDIAVEKKLELRPCTSEDPKLGSHSGVRRYDNEVFSKSRKILIGHSFGGRVLELAVAQAYLGDRVQSLQLYELNFGDDGVMDLDLDALRTRNKRLDEQVSAVDSEISDANGETTKLDATRQSLLEQKQDHERNYSTSTDRRSLAIRELEHLSSSEVAHNVRTEPPCEEYDRVLAEECASNSTQESLPKERELVSCIAEQMRCLYRTNLCSIEDAILRHDVDEAENLKVDLQCGTDSPRDELCQGFVVDEIRASVHRTLGGDDEGKSLDESTNGEDDKEGSSNESKEEIVEDWVDYYCLLRDRSASGLIALDLEMKNEVKNTSDGDAGRRLKARSNIDRFMGWIVGRESWDSITRFLDRSAVVEAKDRLARELDQADTHIDETVKAAREKVEELADIVDLEDKELARIGALIKEVDRELEDNSAAKAELEERIRLLKDNKADLEREIKLVKRDEDVLLNEIWFQKDEYLRPPADLVLLLNAASEAIVSSDLLKAMRGEGVPERATVNVPPAIVSITSETDWATRGLFPVGSLFGSLARFGPTVSPDEYGLEFGTLGHHEDAWTHDVDEGGAADDHPVFSIGCNKFPVVPRTSDTEDEGTSENYVGSKDYWVVRVPRKMIRNHGDIFLNEKDSRDCSDGEARRGPLLGIVEGLIEYGQLFEPFCVIGQDGSCQQRTSK